MGSSHTKQFTSSVLSREINFWHLARFTGLIHLRDQSPTVLPSSSRSACDTMISSAKRYHGFHMLLARRLKNMRQSMGPSTNLWGTSLGILAGIIVYSPTLTGEHLGCSCVRFLNLVHFILPHFLHSVESSSCLFPTFKNLATLRGFWRRCRSISVC